MTETDRPPKPSHLPPDAYEPMPDFLDWSADEAVVQDVRTRQGCRFRSRRRTCGRRIDAVLYRGVDGTRPYGYCRDHLYGRWIEDGVVMGWKVREDWDWMGSR